MKRSIFLFLFVLLLGVNKTQAQQSATVTGSFNAPVVTKLIETLVAVNYTMTLSPAKDNLEIVTNSNDKTFFRIDLLDSENKVLAQWSPSSADVSCSHSFDISGLQPGSYHLNITSSYSKSLQTIPFTK